MTVKVDNTWGGTSDGFGFRLTFPCGSRENLIGWKWSRKIAKRALDIAERHYGAKRKNVRFYHV